MELEFEIVKVYTRKIKHFKAFHISISRRWEFTRNKLLLLINQGNTLYFVLGNLHCEGEIVIPLECVCLDVFIHQSICLSVLTAQIKFPL